MFTGQGTELDPYLIGTAVELAALAVYVNAGTAPYASAGKHYLMTNDIDLSDYQSGAGWVPIGYYSNKFQGVFDGNNHKITGLKINRSADFIGLFGYIDGVTIKNLGVEDVDISGSRDVGGIAGVNSTSTITNCYSTGNISGSDYVGGITVANSDSTITNCCSLNLRLIRISGNDTDFYRISGTQTLTNNIAFNGMINPSGTTTWSPKGLNSVNGEDITKEQINADGTLDGRFLPQNGWTVQNGRLPGLFGQTVEMPEHLR